MAGSDARLRLLNGALPLAGLVLLVIGAAGVPVALVLAWTALALAFIGWVAEAEGFAVPRPGRLPIRSYGCWETPLAFSVRHAGRELLFNREEDELGAWSSEYTVRELAGASLPDLRYEPAAAPSGSWSLRGRAPVGALQFEHHERVSYVTRRSLERALHAAGAR